jgi:hypothetical protein
MNSTAAQASAQQQSSIRTHSELGAAELLEEEEEQARVRERRGSEEAYLGRADNCRSHGGHGGARRKHDGTWPGQARLRLAPQRPAPRRRRPRRRHHTRGAEEHRSTERATAMGIGEGSG